MRSLFATILFVILPISSVWGQNIQPTTTEERSRAIEQRYQMRDNSIFKEFPVRNVGPVVMSGRVTDLAVNPSQPKHFFVGFASGGVWETRNSGNTMTPIFDHQGSLTIGDIALAPSNSDILWVGTGENNSSRSSYAGAGVYKTEDGGKSWEFMGLRNTQHIGRIIIHPSNPEVVWIASVGALYHNNEERGVYKTTNGGGTWKKTLFVNDSTGVIDLIIHPDNPNELWATTWERSRKAWNFKEGGQGSGVYHSTDGGESWTRIINDLPQGKHVGRIGLTISPSKPEILYASVDNQKERTEKKELPKDELIPASFVEMSKRDFKALDNEKLTAYLSRYDFPDKYSAQSLKKDVAEGVYKPKDLAEFVGDANEALFDTDVIGAEVYRSEDGGQSWTKANQEDFEALYYTYGYYFGEVRVSPVDPNTLYMLGVPLLKSTDGGKTWDEIAVNQDVHVDHHALWLDPDDADHLILGNDGGVYESHDGGLNFIHHNVAPVGQFYTVAIDMEEPYNIYGGLQDNGVFYGPSHGSPNDGSHWKRLFGGDGMHVAVDPEDNNIVYTGYQFGNYYKIHKGTNQYTTITPKHDLGEDRYRYNWNTPVNMSHFNSEILYFGSQRLNRSFDGGESWTPISPDLTDNRTPQGNVPYSTITTIAESPLNFNTIWVGTDDGNIQLSRDAGTSWQEVSTDLPQDRWVSEVHASVHDEGTAYVSLTGYRYDEFKSYIYKTTDYGQNWHTVTGDLPQEAVNVIVQDQKEPDLLYAGTDQGTYISFDDGHHWELLNGVPNVASYDMVIHPREQELVIGTHGRSIYVTELTPLQKVAAASDQRMIAISPTPTTIRHSDRWGTRSAPFRDWYEPNITFRYYLGRKRDAGKDVDIRIQDQDDKTVYSVTDDGVYGFNTVDWNLMVQKLDDAQQRGEYLPKGVYTVIFERGRFEDQVTFEIK
ncbi:MAG: WD40/YVTN/BNR-like repeat-containing protein [Bacteroidota bacterium]